MKQESFRQAKTASRKLLMNDGAMDREREGLAKSGRDRFSVGGDGHVSETHASTKQPISQLCQ
jgi:hypothetical protein